ncbi:hypothetical protein ACTHGN_000495 [Pseudomonas putida]
MNLNDAVSYFRSITDQTHRFWAYYQGVTAAVVVLVWSIEVVPKNSGWWLVLGYLLFSLLNCRLIALSQRGAVVAWQCIQDYRQQSSGEIPVPLQPLLDINKPDSTFSVIVMHIALSVFAAWMIWIRT